MIFLLLKYYNIMLASCSMDIMQIWPTFCYDIEKLDDGVFNHINMKGGDLFASVEVMQHVLR